MKRIARSFGLRARIAAVFLALMLAVQLASFLVIRSAIDRNARVVVTNELAVGKRVFDRLMEQNIQNLGQSARVLAADYAFREALLTNDAATIASALDNHGSRIRATVAVLYGADLSLRAAADARKLDAERERLDLLVKQAADTGAASGVALLDGRLHQLVVVPVKAPIVVGWVMMGFAVDAQLAKDMRAVSGLDISFLGRSSGAVLHVLASTLAPDVAARLARQAEPEIDALSAMHVLQVDGQDVGTQIVPLLQDAKHPAYAVLQRSIDELVAPYAKLQLALLILTVIGLATSAVGSIETARQVTGPIVRLAGSAARFGAGGAFEPVAGQRDDESGKLARSFNRMGEGILQREDRSKRPA